MLEDVAALMEEPPGGANHGRSRRQLLNEEFLSRDIALREWTDFDAQRASFLRENGWSIDTVTAHRGVLHPDEHVDLGRVRALVEKYLGFSLETLRDAYRNGRPTAERVMTRAAIDASLLDLSRKGGNMTALARVIGWEVDGTGSCWPMKKALQRARATE